MHLRVVDAVRAEAAILKMVAGRTEATSVDECRAIESGRIAGWARTIVAAPTGSASCAVSRLKLRDATEAFTELAAPGHDPQHGDGRAIVAVTLAPAAQRLPSRQRVALAQPSSVAARSVRSVRGHGSRPPMRSAIVGSTSLALFSVDRAEIALVASDPQPRGGRRRHSKSATRRRLRTSSPDATASGGRRRHRWAGLIESGVTFDLGQACHGRSIRMIKFAVAGIAVTDETMAVDARPIVCALR